MVNESAENWPLDLKIFALVCLIWASTLLVRVLVHSWPVWFAGQMQAVAGGMKFHGFEARIVALVQAVVVGGFALGILARRRWGLVIGLLYLTEAVMSHLIFVLAYLSVRSELLHVKTAAVEGPSIVLILLYLWIRSNALLFHPTRGA